MMKRFTIILSFLLISLNGFCDTLDYWHVYINDSLIAQYNSVSTDLTISLEKASVKKSDVITVRYGNDHPCIDCTYCLEVLVEIMEKTPQAETKEFFGKLSIPLNEILTIEKKYKVTSFYFNYHEKSDKYDYTGGTTRVFTLVLT